MRSYLSVPDGSDSLLGVVLDDGGLVNEHILLGVVPVDEAVSRLDVEPLHGSSHFGGNNLTEQMLIHTDLVLYQFLAFFYLFRLLFSFWLFIPSLLLFGLGLQVSHDGMVVGMVT